MSPQPYLKLALRWRMLWGLLYPMQAQWLMYVTKHDGVHFIAGHLMFPFAIGLALNLTILDALHRSFSFLLPGSRRLFLKSSVVVFTLAAGPSIWLAHWRSPEFPLLATVGVVFASMTVAVLWGPSYKCFGSHRLALGWYFFAALCAWRYEEVKAITQFCPWLVAGVSLVLAGLGFKLGFSRERLRARAMEYCIAPSNAVFNGKQMQYVQALRRANSQSFGRDWERAPIGDSARAWMAALRFETLGAIRRPWLWGLTVFGFMVAMFLFVPFMAVEFQAHGRPTLEAVFKAVHASLFGEPSPFPVVIMLPMFYLLLSVTVNFPTPMKLYPASRRRMVDLTLLIALRQFVLAGLVMVAASVGLAWVVCWLVDKPFVFSRVPIFSFPFAALPAIPLLLLGLLKSKRGGATPNAGVLAIILVSCFGLIIVVCLVFNWVFTPIGLAFVVLGTLVNTLLFVRGVKKFYLHSDLIGRANA